MVRAFETYGHNSRFNLSEKQKKLWDSRKCVSTSTPNAIDGNLNKQEDLVDSRDQVVCVLCRAGTCLYGE